MQWFNISSLNQWSILGHIALPLNLLVGRTFTWKWMEGERAGEGLIENLQSHFNNDGEYCLAWPPWSCGPHSAPCCPGRYGCGSDWRSLLQWSPSTTHQAGGNPGRKWGWWWSCHKMTGQRAGAPWRGLGVNKNNNNNTLIQLFTNENSDCKGL